MFPKYPDFRVLTDNDKKLYDSFYYSLRMPSSDYCFTVVQTWLAFSSPVEVTQINSRILLLRYKDILSSDKNQTVYSFIGDPGSVTEYEIELISHLTQMPNSKFVLTEPLFESVQLHLSDSLRYSEEPGLADYIYSVSDYCSLEKPTYRGIRRKINAFNRLYDEVRVELKELDLTNQKNKSIIINAHHGWEKTYQYENDPERAEGMILTQTIDRAEALGVRCIVGKVDEKIEGIFIFTELSLSTGHYINLHNARFSYEYKFINDYLWKELANFINKEGVEYINFERDSDIEGLRTHKLLLKPVRINKVYLVCKN